MPKRGDLDSSLSLAVTHRQISKLGSAAAKLCGSFSSWGQQGDVSWSRLERPLQALSVSAPRCKNSNGVWGERKQSATTFAGWGGPTVGGRGSQRAPDSKPNLRATAKNRYCLARCPKLIRVCRSIHLYPCKSSGSMVWRPRSSSPARGLAPKPITDPRPA